MAQGQVYLDDNGNEIKGAAPTYLDEQGNEIKAAGPTIAPSLLASRQVASKAQFEENLPPNTLGSRTREYMLGLLEPFDLHNVPAILQGVGRAADAARLGDISTLAGMAKDVVTAPLQPLKTMYEAAQEGDWNKAAYAAGGITSQTLPVIAGVGKLGSEILPSRAHAGENFQTLKQAVGNVPWTRADVANIQAILDETKTKFTKAGGTPPKIFSDAQNVINNQKMMGSTYIPYDDPNFTSGRDLAQQAGKKLAGIARLVNPPDPGMDAQTAKLAAAIDTANRGAAQSQGLQGIYNSAMGEYRDAMRLKSAVKKAVPLAIGGSVLYKYGQNLLDVLGY